MQVEINSLNLIGPKEKRLQFLYKQFLALYAQLDTVMNNAEKIAIEEDIKQKEAEINHLQTEIKRLRALESGSDRIYRNSFNNWQEKFTEIDFSKANLIINNVLNKIKNQEGAALFFLQNSSSMKGDLCIKKLESQLKSMGHWYRPYILAFSPYQKVNQANFLNFLAENLGIDPYPIDLSISTSEISLYTNDVIRKICGSLCSGHILFIQVDIYYLNPENQFLNWFLNEFWCPLVRQLPELSQRHRLVRFVAVLAIRGSLPKDCLPSSLYCKKQNLDREKFLELPLQKWKDKDIENWLINFSGLDSHQSRGNDEKFQQMAKTIYEVTRGEPCKVYDELMDQMTRLVS
ncbi:hypothetical protein [[Phormidium ambiguum] IAM M-71]|nr:hypothetical protein [Phormidium ambiguum]